MKAEEEKTLNMLRTVWKECSELRDRIEDPSCDDTQFLRADALSLTERTRMILGSVFFNSKFSSDYVEMLKKAYDDRGDYLIPATAVSLTQSYIRTVGQLFKAGYVKDPYSGINNEASQICFVAMWFSPDMEELFANGIKAPVESLGYHVVRVDKEQYNGRIDQKIIESIRKARFLIADLSGNRAGVYYEGGFAAGQGIPVIHTCHTAYFEERHFDVHTINTIEYGSSGELAEKLKERVMATIGAYKAKETEVVEEDFPF